MINQRINPTIKNIVMSTIQSVYDYNYFETGKQPTFDMKINVLKNNLLDISFGSFKKEYIDSFLLMYCENFWYEEIGQFSFGVHRQMIQTIFLKYGDYFNKIIESEAKVEDIDEMIKNYEMITKSRNKGETTSDSEGEQSDWNKSFASDYPQASFNGFENNFDEIGYAKQGNATNSKAKNESTSSGTSTGESVSVTTGRMNTTSYVDSLSKFLQAYPKAWELIMLYFNDLFMQVLN